MSATGLIIFPLTSCVYGRTAHVTIGPEMTNDLSLNTERLESLKTFLRILSISTDPAHHFQFRAGFSNSRRSSKLLCRIWRPTTTPFSFLGNRLCVLGRSYELVLLGRQTLNNDRQKGL